MAKGAIGVLMLGWLLIAAPSLADGRVQFLADRMKYPPASGEPDDFRVRTNAALALGATHEDGAIGPLCGGLTDPSDVVRQAVAVALKRLARAASLPCLRGRSAVEVKPSVKQQIDRAIDAIEAAQEAPAEGSRGAAVATPRFYVSVSRIVNHSSRDSSEVERIVREAIASKLAEVGGYEIAPMRETSEAARAVVTKRRLKGYFLSVSVDPFDYSGDGLRVRVKIAVFSYPGKDLRGEVPAGATLAGARAGDSNSEDQLMGVVAARATELFAQNFQ
ncbi:MAG: HEAT repeat domain-containing protein [Polyangiaceae bacterium]|jgi:hypothetical protein